MNILNIITICCVSIPLVPFNLFSQETFENSSNIETNDSLVDTVRNRVIVEDVRPAAFPKLDTATYSAFVSCSDSTNTVIDTIKLKAHSQDKKRLLGCGIACAAVGSIVIVALVVKVVKNATNDIGFQGDFNLHF